MLQIGDGGLTLGHGTVLARWAQNRPGQAFAEADDERVIVLLSTVYGRAVSPHVMKHVARAAKRCGAGKKALAHIELAFAGLPRLESSADAYRLFLADSLLDDGTTPRQLARALGFDPDLLKYDPDQPCVPAGSGRDSGRWGGGAGEGVIEGRSSAGPATDRRMINAPGRITPSSLTFTALRVAANGHLEPDGADVIPFPRVDPLDPHQLNLVPSPPEQQAIADTLNIIRTGQPEDDLGRHQQNKSSAAGRPARYPSSAIG